MEIRGGVVILFLICETREPHARPTRGRVALPLPYSPGLGPGGRDATLELSDGRHGRETIEKPGTFDGTFPPNNPETHFP